MSVWIQSLFSALLLLLSPLPSPPQINMIQNGKSWMVVASSGLKQGYLLLPHVMLEKTSVFVTGELKKKGKKKMTSIDSHCSARCFVFLSWAGAWSQRASLHSSGKLWTPPPTAMHQGTQLLCSAAHNTPHCWSWHWHGIWVLAVLSCIIYVSCEECQLNMFPNKLDMWVMINLPWKSSLQN